MCTEYLWQLKDGSLRHIIHSPDDPWIRYYTRYDASDSVSRRSTFEEKLLAGQIVNFCDELLEVNVNGVGEFATLDSAREFFKVYMRNPVVEEVTL